MAYSGSTYLVTGSSRGIGLEFVKQLLHGGAKVIAGARSPAKAQGLQDLLKAFPDDLFTVQLDVADEASIKAAAATVSATFPGGIDVLINNAGIGGTSIESSAPDTAGAELLEVLQTNVVGVHLTTAYFLPLVRKGQAKKIINISTTMSSISGNLAGLNGKGFFPGHFLSYRTSKAALNMAGTVWANAVQSEGITVLSLHPGWVQTDMGGQAATLVGEGVKPDLTPEQSVTGQLKVIGEVTIEKTGQLVDWNGESIAW